MRKQPSACSGLFTSISEPLLDFGSVIKKQPAALSSGLKCIILLQLRQWGRSLR